MKRYLLYFFGLNLLAIGIIINIAADLGVAALSSPIYVSSQIFHITLGTASIIAYLIFVFLQCLLSRKIKKEYILEIPLSFVFGFLTDFYDRVVFVSPKNMVHSLVLLFVATISISLGVYFTVVCNVILNPGDGIVYTLSEVLNKSFSLMKNLFDIAMIIIAILLCVLTRNRVIGIGIGTILSAIFTGRFIALWKKVLDHKIKELLYLEES